MTPQMNHGTAGQGAVTRDDNGTDRGQPGKGPTFRSTELARLFQSTRTPPVNTATDTALIIAFVAAVLLFAVFGYGALSGHMSNVGANGSGWTWAPALVGFGIGVLFFGAILKKDLLQLAWEKDHYHGLSRRLPHRLYAGTDIDRIAEARSGILCLPW